MTVTAKEKPGSREVTGGDNPGSTVVYIIQGTADDGAAYEAMMAEAPAWWQGIPRREGIVREKRIREGSPGLCIWEGTVRYSTWVATPAPSTGDNVFEFRAGGGSEHIQRSLETVHVYPRPGTTAPDQHGYIGVQASSGQAGVTVLGMDRGGGETTGPGTSAWTERVYVPAGIVNAAYRRILMNGTWHVNSSAFRGWDAGEILFTSLQGGKRGLGDWELSFEFARSANERNIIRGAITGIEKRGWDYLWEYYAVGVDEGAQKLVAVPEAVYVERVYDYLDFRVLGIGVA